MTPFELTALIGAITGSISLGFLVFKSITDRPKLKFEVVRKFFFPSEKNPPFTSIVINMKVHNRGSKPTTIHHSKLTFDYNSEQKELEDDRSSFEILPDRTVDYAPMLSLHESDLILRNKITNCVLTITHTHDEKIIDLGTIEE